MFPRVAATQYYRLGASTTEMYSLSILEAGSPRSSCLQGWLLERENVFHASLLGSGGVDGMPRSGW